GGAGRAPGRGGGSRPRRPPDPGEARLERTPVALDVFRGPARQARRQPVRHRLLDRVTAHRPHARVQVRVQVLELVLDLGLGLAADLLPGPLPVRAIPQRHNAAPAPRAATVMSGVAAVTSGIEVDAVLAVAASRHDIRLLLGSPLGSPPNQDQNRASYLPAKTGWS